MTTNILVSAIIFFIFFFLPSLLEVGDSNRETTTVDHTNLSFLFIKNLLEIIPTRIKAN